MHRERERERECGKYVVYFIQLHHDFWSTIYIRLQQQLYISLNKEMLIYINMIFVIYSVKKTIYIVSTVNKAQIQSNPGIPRVSKSPHPIRIRLTQKFLRTVRFHTLTILMSDRGLASNSCWWQETNESSLMAEKNYCWWFVSEIRRFPTSWGW